MGAAVGRTGSGRMLVLAMKGQMLPEMRRCVYSSGGAGNGYISGPQAGAGEAGDDRHDVERRGSGFEGPLAE